MKMRRLLRILGPLVLIILIGGYAWWATRTIFLQRKELPPAEEVRLEPGGVGLTKLEQELGLATTPEAVHYRTGMGYLSRRELSEAKEEFEEALKIKPDFLLARLGLAYFYQASRDYESAIGEYKKVIEREPKQVEAHMNLGLAYSHLGESEEAIQAAKKAIELSPRNHLTHYNLGVIYLRGRRMEEALETFKKVIQIKRNFMPAYQSIANVYSEQGRFDQADFYLKSALRVNPSLALRLNLAALYERQGKIGEAVNEYRRIIASAPIPALATAYNNLAWYYAQQDATRIKALELAETARFLKPNDPRILDTLGWIYFQRGNYQKALINLKKAKEMIPPEAQAQVLYHLGETHLKLGAKKEALAELERALRLSPDIPQARRVRELIAQLKPAQR